MAVNCIIIMFMLGLILNLGINFIENDKSDRNISEARVFITNCFLLTCLTGIIISFFAAIFFFIF